METPKWAPGSVGSAYRHGPADGTSGVRAGLGRPLASLAGPAGPRSGAGPAGRIDQAAGYRHLLVLLALGIDEALRASDPYRPRLRPGQRGQRPQVGDGLSRRRLCRAPPSGPTPPMSSAAGGERVRYLGFQVMGGIESLANIVAEDLGPVGRRHFRASCCRPPSNQGTGCRSLRGPRRWWCVSSSTTGTNEEPAELSIECTSGPRVPSGHPPATVGRRRGPPVEPWAIRRGQRRVLARHRGRRTGPGPQLFPRARRPAPTSGAAAENVRSGARGSSTTTRPW